MTSYEIEKNVPVPEQGGRSQYPFADMQVGDSFFAEGKKPEQLQNAATHWRKKKGWKFAARKESNGARIWRVS